MSPASLRRLRGPEREANARAVLRRLAASGSSKSAFCRAERISAVTLFRWLREFGPAARPATDGAFVEVRLGPEPTRPGFELEIASGRRLRIPSGFDVGDLERLLVLLERAPC